MLHKVEPFLHLYHVTSCAVVGILPLALEILAQDFGVVVSVDALNVVFDLPLNLLVNAR